MNAYRSLVAWQRAHEISMRTLHAIDAVYHPRAGAMFEQLRRAVISVEANIVEGYALESPAYFAKHVRIAFGSLAEAEVLLLDSCELGYLPEALLTELQPLIDHCMRLLRGLLNRDRRSRLPTPHAPRPTPRS